MRFAWKWRRRRSVTLVLPFNWPSVNAMERRRNKEGDNAKLRCEQLKQVAISEWRHVRDAANGVKLASRVTVHVYPWRRHAVDADAACRSGKAVLDAAVNAGVLLDDGHSVVKCITYHAGTNRIPRGVAPGYDSGIVMTLKGRPWDGRTAAPKGSMPEQLAAASTAMPAEITGA